MYAIKRQKNTNTTSILRTYIKETKTTSTCRSCCRTCCSWTWWPVLPTRLPCCRTAAWRHLPTAVEHQHNSQCTWTGNPTNSTVQRLVSLTSSTTAVCLYTTRHTQCSLWQPTYGLFTAHELNSVLGVFTACKLNWTDPNKSTQLHKAFTGHMCEHHDHDHTHTDSSSFQACTTTGVQCHM